MPAANHYRRETAVRISDILKRPHAGLLPEHLHPALYTALALEIGGPVKELVLGSDDGEDREDDEERADGGDTPTVDASVASALRARLHADYRVLASNASAGIGVVLMDGRPVALFLYAPELEDHNAAVRVEGAMISTTVLDYERGALAGAFVAAATADRAPSYNGDADSPVTRLYGWPDAFVVSEQGLSVQPVVDRVAIGQFGDAESGSSLEVARRADGSLLVETTYIPCPDLAGAAPDDRMALAVATVDMILARPRHITTLEVGLGEDYDRALLRHPGTPPAFTTSPWGDGKTLATGASSDALFRERCRGALARLFQV